MESMKERDVVEALIVRNNHEVLLQKKTLDYSKAPGKWSLFGGEVEESEDKTEALKREMSEEIGIRLEKIKLFKSESYCLKDVNGLECGGHRHIFIVEFDSGASISDIKLTEGAGFAFFDFSELESVDTSELCKKTLKEYLSK